MDLVLGDLFVVSRRRDLILLHLGRENCADLLLDLCDVGTDTVSTLCLLRREQTKPTISLQKIWNKTWKKIDGCLKKNKKNQSWLSTLVQSPTVQPPKETLVGRIHFKIRAHSQSSYYFEPNRNNDKFHLLHRANYMHESLWGSIQLFLVAAVHTDCATHCIPFIHYNHKSTCNIPKFMKETH